MVDALIRRAVRTLLTASLVFTTYLAGTLPAPAQNLVVPARYRAGPLPPVMVQAVGGGEVFLEVAVGETGRVERVMPFRVTPPFAEPLIAAVQQWQFRPAEEEDLTSPLKPRPRRAARSRVLVAALFRPPTLTTPTLGTLPSTVARGSDEIPHPLMTVTPLYPPAALFDGIVMVEVEINTRGTVTETTVVGSAPPFDRPAVEAARHWTFRPAQWRGRRVQTLAYIVFGFRQPITAPGRR